MTTTGDLFVNIKGDNKGLKRTLDQSSRQVQGFAKKTEDRMKNGLGIGDIAALGALANIRSLPGLINRVQRGRRGMREIAEKADSYRMSQHIRREMGFEKRFFHGMQFPDTARRIEDMKARKRRLNADRNALLPMQRTVKALLSAPAVTAAVAGMVGAVWLTNANKWQKRNTQAASKFSGAVIANKARIDAANIKRDIRLAKDPGIVSTTLMRQNAANYRANSGNPGFGNAMNVAGAGWDYFIGFMTNALTNNPYTHGGVI